MYMNMNININMNMKMNMIVIIIINMDMNIIIFYLLCSLFCITLSGILPLVWIVMGVSFSLKLFVGTHQFGSL